MTKSGNEIREEFIAFFQKHGHAFVPSSSLLPADDPTLLFANAGMNQFKPLFLGTETRDYTRACNTQKCIRAGGKHNDLDDVGRDCYHHTFFEMLGNWSFGDYFKKEAIAWAWQLLTEVWGLPKDRLHVTVFEGDASDGLEPDDEAARLWLEVTDIEGDHIHQGSKKDNFWEMGETGPCGPCSEIHIDLTPDKSGASLVNAGHPRVIEIWNLVFIQFNRDASGKLSPLPARHVDTGMGLERVTAVLQGKNSNYATDLFVPILKHIEELSGKTYGEGCDGDRYDATDEDNLTDVAMRVIADHARALTFAIADGILPSNDGRGYVLRSILRRAAGFGRQYLGIEGPFLHRLVSIIVKHFADAFGELSDRQAVVEKTILDEEESFQKTLDRGLDFFRGALYATLLGAAADQSGKNPEKRVSFGGGGGGFREVEKLKEDRTTLQEKGIRPLSKDYEIGVNINDQLVQVDIGDWTATRTNDLFEERPTIAGQYAFELHATYGFPIALTKLMAEKIGLAVDETGFEQAMEEHRQTSRAGGGAFKADAVVGLPETDDSPKYDPETTEAQVLGWVQDGQFLSEGELPEGDEAAIVLDRTGFYPEAGGQIGDCGTLVSDGCVFDVEDTQPTGKSVLHVGKVRHGKLTAGQTVRCEVCHLRFDTMRNHSATHLLNWALRKVLGETVDQAGSVVDPQRLRFDFTHSHALSDEELREVERLVNRRVLNDEVVLAKEMPLEDAKKIPGVRAVFGEKYPDPVRVVTMGTGEAGDPHAVSVEFCGGTHLRRTSQVGLFKIVSEESVAKGVRRITAVTGPAAAEWARQADGILKSASRVLKTSPEEIPERIESMRKEIKKLKKKPAAGPASGPADVTTLDTPAGQVVVARAPAVDAAAMRSLCDQQRQKGAVAVFLGAADEEEGKVMLTAMVDDELAKSKTLRAGDWVKAVAPVVGGGGGGKPTLAQAGGKQPEKLPDALKEAERFAKEALDE